MVDVWVDTPLGGVVRRTLPAVDDARGSFRELWRASWTVPIGTAPFVQSNLSRSRAGVLRGLHFHLRQTDLWVVLEGRAHVSLVDVRGHLDGSTGSPLTFAGVLGTGEAIVIPEGVAHGLWALEPAALLYLVTNEYDGTDEHGFAWNDSEAAAEWPAGQPILSDRDRTAPSLAAAITAAQVTRQISSR